MHIPKRGEIWLVSLDPTKGSEIKKTRPCVIMSRDEFNAKAATVTLIPITSGPARYITWEVEIDLSAGLDIASHIVIPQIRVAAKERLKKPLGFVDSNCLDELEEKLLFYLGVEGGTLTIGSKD